MKILIANWKMNLPPEGINDYMAALRYTRSHDTPMVVCPPFTYLHEVVSRAAGHVLAGAQNCGDQKSGAFTGEVSASMLKQCGATHVIVGHSERRNVYREDDAMIARRLAMAIDNGLVAVLCIGENLAVREGGRVAQHLSEQIQAVVSPSLENGEVIIAYEPVWAIGTGRNATGAMCAETLAEIRSAVSRYWPSRHHNGAILYGGSVTPDNIADLWMNGCMDGFLVGGASLDSSKFLAIYDAMRPA